MVQVSRTLIFSAGGGVSAMASRVARAFQRVATVQFQVCCHGPESACHLNIGISLPAELRFIFALASRRWLGHDVAIMPSLPSPHPSRVLTRRSLLQCSGYGVIGASAMHFLGRGLEVHAAESPAGAGNRYATDPVWLKAKYGP